MLDSIADVVIDDTPGNDGAGATAGSTSFADWKGMARPGATFGLVRGWWVGLRVLAWPVLALVWLLWAPFITFVCLAAAIGQLFMALAIMAVVLPISALIKAFSSKDADDE